MAKGATYPKRAVFPNSLRRDRRFAACRVVALRSRRMTLNNQNAIHYVKTLYFITIYYDLLRYYDIMILMDFAMYLICLESNLIS